MLEDIEREANLTASYTGIQRIDPEILAVMGEIPREAFVLPEMRAYAYDNRPLPIAHEQTISQPYIVALMTHLLRPRPQHRLLEIGTGSGYQTAILARLVARVYSLDRIPELVAAARRLFDRLGYTNIETVTGNGYRGWPEHAPYDGIIVTAAATHIPPALIEQLAPGGRLVIPVGPPFGHQELLTIEKDDAGELLSNKVLPVAFVPMHDDVPSTDT
jgi:protein-L-isoaspartate(D-aspartate) O-methyltransferase